MTRKSAEPHDIETELAALRADIAVLASSLGAYGLDKVGALTGQAQGMTDEAREAARKTLQDIRAQIDTLEQDLETGIRDHPVRAMLLAFGLGMLLSKLLKR